MCTKDNWYFNVCTDEQQSARKHANSRPISKTNCLNASSKDRNNNMNHCSHFYAFLSFPFLTAFPLLCFSLHIFLPFPICWSVKQIKQITASYFLASYSESCSFFPSHSFTSAMFACSIQCINVNQYIHINSKSAFTILVVVVLLHPCGQ